MTSTMKMIMITIDPMRGAPVGPVLELLPSEATFIPEPDSGVRPRSLRVYRPRRVNVYCRRCFKKGWIDVGMTSPESARTPTLLKRCPSCGKYFEVRHTGERLEGSDVGEEEVGEYASLDRIGTDDSESVTDEIDMEPGVGPVSVGERRVDEEVDTYDETYTCKHCGYRWTEKVVRTKPIADSPPPSKEGSEGQPQG